MLSAPNNVWPIHARPNVCPAAPPAPSRASAAKIGTSMLAQSAGLLGSNVAGCGMRAMVPLRIHPIYRFPSGPTEAEDMVNGVAPFLGSVTTGQPPAAL